MNWGAGSVAGDLRPFADRVVVLCLQIRYDDLFTFTKVPERAHVDLEEELGSVG